MFSVFIIALREGFETAIAIAIMVAYLRKTGRESLMPSVITGIGLGVVASVLGAVLLNSYYTAEEGVLEGPLLLIASVLVISMIIWMWRTSMQLGSQVSRVVNKAEGRSLWRTRLTMGGFAFVLVIREGIELVVFILAISTATQATQWVTVSVLGVLTAIAVCYAVVRGMVGVNILQFFKASALVLVIFVAELVIGAFHELVEQNMIPNPGRSVMYVVDGLAHAHIFANIAVGAFVLLIPYALIQSWVKKQRTVPARPVAVAVEPPSTGGSR